MRGQGHRFRAPWRKPKQRADPDPPKARHIGTLRSFQPPVEMTFWTRSVHFGIDTAIVGFLIDHQTFRPCFDQRLVFRNFHWSQLERDRRKKGPKRVDAVEE